MHTKHAHLLLPAPLHVRIRLPRHPLLLLLLLAAWMRLLRM
jgi:hypothetical protein